MQIFRSATVVVERDPECGVWFVAMHRQHRLESQLTGRGALRKDEVTDLE